MAAKNSTYMGVKAKSPSPPASPASSAEPATAPPGTDLHPKPPHPPHPPKPFPPKPHPPKPPCEPCTDQYLKAINFAVQPAVGNLKVNDLIQFPTLVLNAGFSTPDGGKTWVNELGGLHEVKYAVGVVSTGGSTGSVNYLEILLNGVPLPGSGTAFDSDRNFNITLQGDQLVKLPAGTKLAIRFNANGTPPTSAKTIIIGTAVAPVLCIHRLNTKP